MGLELLSRSGILKDSSWDQSVTCPHQKFDNHNSQVWWVSWNKASSEASDISESQLGSQFLEVYWYFERFLMTPHLSDSVTHSRWQVMKEQNFIRTPVFRPFREVLSCSSVDP
ncbi:hypothetical protein U0070_002418, partial [Myodes glareolus]